MPQTRVNYRLGVDIGGTFTDLVLAGSDGAFLTRKVASTPDDYSRGILEGIAVLLEENQIPPSAVAEIVHGTTVATNAIVEYRGARTALLTTKGFRDVLELRRLRVPELYSLFYRPPKALAERRLRLEVDERIDVQGRVLRPLDEATVQVALDLIEEERAEAVAVCLLHSYRNPDHERRVGEIVRQRLPDVYLSLSVDLLPEIREYERTSTTVANAYVGPIVRGYLRSLRERLAGAGVGGRLRIMQSNGGVMSAEAAEVAPARIVESGPAAGVVGAHHAVVRAGLKNAISFDMGGTTAKASIIEGGNRGWTTEYEVGGGISLSSRLIKGRGYALKLPVIDIAEVGAGGGSVVWIDRGGALKVGPHSAGAVPGPVCYSMGGNEPTVTDANVVLGYVNPEALAGGSVPIKADLAAQALTDLVARPLGLSLERVAAGVHAVANDLMIRAVKAVSTHRGRDPRHFTLFAFGGNGGIHGAGIARMLGMRHVIVPASPGVFSAVGLLEADPEQHFVRTFIGVVAHVEPDAVEEAFTDLERQAASTMSAEGEPGGRSEVALSRQADLRYEGQNYELTVPVPAGNVPPAEMLNRLADAFHDEHMRMYGHSAPGEAVQLVNLRVTASGAASSAIQLRRGIRGRSEQTGLSGPSGRDVYFSGEGAMKVDIVRSRAELGSRVRPGPLLIEEYDSTIVVPPDTTARLDEGHSVVLEIR